MGYRPISDYGVIGDMHSAALVSRDGSIDWLCFPRFDSPSVFSSLLDDEIGGRFWIRPDGDFESGQRYLEDTNILVTEFVTHSGRALVTDFMPISDDVATCSHQLVRTVTCESGRVDFVVDYDPRLEYASGSTDLTTDGHVTIARSGTFCLSLVSEVEMSANDSGATSRFSLAAGEEATFVMHWDEQDPPDIAAYDPAARLRETEEFWTDVACDWSYEGAWESLIRRSMLALHLLIYAPSGAVCAAATTSLPEQIGGVRNWDYRFTWLRDAAFTFDIFHRLGHTEYTRPFLDWLTERLTDGDSEHELHTLYEIAPGDGGSDTTEYQLDHLSGYRDSRPVRVGNAAYHQLQLDMFGEVVMAIYSYHRAGGEVDDALWHLTHEMVDSAARRWQEPDAGIWEFRTEPRHFTHSKLMCWVALDRGIQLATALKRPSDLEGWKHTCAAIRNEILERGWNEKRGAFTQYLDGESLDASLLFLPMVGFLPGGDPRVISTINAICDELGEDGLIHRYIPERADDGLPGTEGTFTMCTLWLAGALFACGRIEEATALFEKIVSMGNHVGIYSEMFDPTTGDYLGNYPQAFTHIALIHTARNLDRAARGANAR